jgi:hypothetical protein
MIDQSTLRTKRNPASERRPSGGLQTLSALRRLLDHMMNEPPHETLLRPGYGSKIVPEGLVQVGSGLSWASLSPSNTSSVTLPAVSYNDQAFGHFYILLRSPADSESRAQTIVRWKPHAARSRTSA